MRNQTKNKTNHRSWQILLGAVRFAPELDNPIEMLYTVGMTRSCCRHDSIVVAELEPDR
jgi:hypothetical protein